MILKSNTKNGIFKTLHEGKTLNVQLEADYIKSKNLLRYDLELLCNNNKIKKVQIQNRKRSKNLIILNNVEIKSDLIGNKNGSFKFHNGLNFVDVMMVSEFAKTFSKKTSRQKVQYYVKNDPSLKGYYLNRINQKPLILIQV